MARTPNIFPPEIFLVPSSLHDRTPNKKHDTASTALTTNMGTPITELLTTRTTLAMPSRVQILEMTNDPLESRAVWGHQDDDGI